MKSVANIIRLTSIVQKHLPEILTVIGVVGTVINNIHCEKRDARYWMLMYEHTGSEYYKIRYLQMTKSNNWLRTHGYPMRRKNH